MDRLKFGKIKFGLIILIIISCKSQSDFITISNDIYKIAITNNNRTEFKRYAKTDNKIRKQLFKKGELSFFESSEPLFILDGYDLETNDIYTEMWNSKGHICYKKNNAEYKQIDGGFYSDNLKLLIKDWNTEIIKQNMTEKGLDLGGLDISATAVLFLENGEIDQVKSFSFSQYNGSMKEIIEYEKN